MASLPPNSGVQPAGFQPKQDFVTGSIVADRYLVQDKIGEGATCDVYLAKQLALKRPVALKLFQASSALSSNVIDRTLDEARLLASIDHECIVRVIDVDRTRDGRSFIVLEYIDGIPLDRLVADHGALPWRWSARTGLQVLSALSLLHSCGVLHLDVKPANCVNVGRLTPLSRDPRTKLVDFGTARWKSVPIDQLAIGTPAYRAPEQALGDPLDERTDVYCVGAMLYELLTGKPPNRLALYPPSEAPLGSDIPSALDTAVLRALQLDASRRYPSASQFAADIDVALRLHSPIVKL